MQTIPIPLDTDSFIQTVSLDDGFNSYPIRIELTWNNRMGQEGEGNWVISFSTTEGVGLIEGIPLVVGMPLTSRFAEDALGKGYFYCFHNEGLQEVKKKDLFNKRAEIYYFTELEYNDVIKNLKLLPETRILARLRDTPPTYLETYGVPITQVIKDYHEYTDNVYSYTIDLGTYGEPFTATHDAGTYP